MTTVSMRIGKEQKDLVDEIAQATGASRRHVVDQAIEAYYDRWREEQEALRRIRKQRDE